MENMRITFVPLSQFKPTPGPLYHVFLGIIQWSFQLRNFQVFPPVFLFWLKSWVHSFTSCFLLMTLLLIFLFATSWFIPATETAFGSWALWAAFLRLSIVNSDPWGVSCRWLHWCQMSEKALQLRLWRLAVFQTLSLLCSSVFSVFEMWDPFLYMSSPPSIHPPFILHSSYIDPQAQQNTQTASEELKGEFQLKTNVDLMLSLLPQPLSNTDF